MKAALINIINPPDYITFIFLIEFEFTSFFFDSDHD